jgi:hypothetical protein
MKTISRISFMVMLVCFAACTAQQIHDTATSVQGGVAVAATAVGAGTPWGLILGAVGSVAGVIASLTGAHAVATAQAQGTDPHPVSDFLANHTYLYPVISSALSILNPFIMHLSPTDLAAINGMLLVAFGTQAGSSLIVKAGTPDPTPAPAPVPAVPAVPKV